jgi:hypothetical protein
MFYRYDVNGDGEIDIADAQGIMNLANGLNWDGTQPSSVRGSRNALVDATYKMTAVKKANGVTRYAITFSGNAMFTAVQMDVVLTNGMKVVAETANGMQLSGNSLRNGNYRMLGFGEMYENGTLYVDVMGEGTVSLDNVVLTTANARSIKPANNDATTINAIAADNQNTEFFGLNGKKLNSAVKGVNIVRNADGTVSKVLKK